MKKKKRREKKRIAIKTKSIKTTQILILTTITLPSERKKEKKKEKAPKILLVPDSSAENRATPQGGVSPLLTCGDPHVLSSSSRYCRKPDFRARMGTANVCGWASCVEKGVASPLPLSHGTSGRTRADHGTASSNGVPPDDPRNPETS